MHCICIYLCVYLNASYVKHYFRLIRNSWQGLSKILRPKFQAHLPFSLRKLRWLGGGYAPSPPPPTPLCTGIIMTTQSETRCMA